MQILLMEEVEHLGKAGQLVEVKPGYARNYLVPHGKARMVTRNNVSAIEKDLERIKALDKKHREELRGIAAKLSDVNCTVECRADENDKLYGSVTGVEIAKVLKISGIEINPKCIELPEAIKKIGVYDVVVKLETDIKAALKVWVVKAD
ncbi:MAG: 50S ribosomal protein L9 [Planctomycetes bacterium]|nr:50S ribosomal protein L9 [Planctomycetota bacterium]